MREPGDLKVICVDCGYSFTLTARELLFYSARALAQPKRCVGCRDQRRREGASAGAWPENGQGGR